VDFIADLAPFASSGVDFLLHFSTQLAQLNPVPTHAVEIIHVQSARLSFDQFTKQCLVIVAVIKDLGVMFGPALFG